MKTDYGTKHTSGMTQEGAYGRTRDYFLGESLKPSDNIPDLLTENRKIALSLAEGVMNMVGVIANHFGIPTMELVMEALPEVSLQLEADGIREKAAAKTYLDLQGSVPLAEICRGTHAYPVPTLHCIAQEILRREHIAKYAPHDPLLKRIFCDLDSGKSDSASHTKKEPETDECSEPDEDEPDDPPLEEN